jgi:cardiolipin synthase (CMP-forming)
MMTSLPNLLTISRIVAIPLVIAAFYLPPVVHPDWARWGACVVFSAAGLTDWLDGHLARRWHQQSDFGRFLDPIADKLLVSATLLMLAAFDQISHWALIPALIILAREILVSGLREHLALIRVGVPVTRLAKWKTVIQMVAIGVLIVGDSGPGWLPVQAIGEILLWIAGILTCVTGYDYLRAGLVHMSAEPTKPPPGAKPSRAAL